MNCLLLLIILFYCNGNRDCSTNNCERRNRGVNRYERSGCGTQNYERRECDCDAKPVVNTCPTSQPRTQFPYLDVEPRTCGCEEKENS